MLTKNLHNRPTLRSRLGIAEAVWLEGATAGGCYRWRRRLRRGERDERAREAHPRSSLLSGGAEGIRARPFAGGLARGGAGGGQSLATPPGILTPDPAPDKKLARGGLKRWIIATADALRFQSPFECISVTEWQAVESPETSAGTACLSRQPPRSRATAVSTCA